MSQKNKLTAVYSLGDKLGDHNDENGENKTANSDKKSDYTDKKHSLMSKMLADDPQMINPEPEEETRGRTSVIDDGKKEKPRDTTPKRDRTPTRNERGRKRKLITAPSIDAAKEEPLVKKLNVEKEIKLPIFNGIELTTFNLDKLIPKSFKIVPFPKDFVQKQDETPNLSKFDSLLQKDEYSILENDIALISEDKFDPQLVSEIPDLKDIQMFRGHDVKVFNKLIVTKDTPLDTLPEHDQLEIRCMKLILKVKNSGQQTRKIAMRTLSDHAKEFGPEIMFNIILPLMADKGLEENERHILVKIIARVLLKLDNEIKPFTRKILAVTMPLLLDDSMYVKLEGREIISNLAKSAGLVSMINSLREDLSSDDDYTRNLVARTFAVVANAIGVQPMVPFLRSICLNKDESYLVRHTGLRIIQNMSIVMGSSILPHLNHFVTCIEPNINDENNQIRTISAATINSLAISCAPYGFESLKPLLEPLWNGLKQQRGKTLSQFMRAIGSLIPLMDPQYANYYTSEIMRTVAREMGSPDEDMKITVLNIIERVCSLKEIDKSIIVKSKVFKSFLNAFWLRRTAMDKKFLSLCVNACFSISLKIGSSKVIDEILLSLKDESEPFRRMTLETCDKIIVELGSYDLSDRSVTRLLDGLVYTFQKQNLENKKVNNIVLNGLGNIIGNLGVRVKPNIMTITSSVLYRLQNKDPQVREQAADLISKFIPVVVLCQENDLLIRLGTILYESLGEIYPDVLGSILGALHEVLVSIKNVDDLNPPIAQILSTLTPILRNRHEKVQEKTINLIGDIAEKAKDFINHREWIRISFELLEMLKAYKKSIRKAANNTFGLIAQAVGPADVLVTLLNNLKMQERQLRVCTSVAIGIISERCKPFTVLPALMNEYRVMDKNVQNGVLKSMSFMFEYTLDLGSDYIYACTPLILDALTDRDLVHRQIASGVVYHMAFGAIGRGLDDAFINFLDLIWPNIFETSPHVISQVMDTIQALNLVLGPGILLNYLWEGLYHPSRKVRAAYWRVWNMIYIDSQHSFVPYLPRFKQVGPSREHLEAKIEDLGVEELDIWV